MARFFGKVGFGLTKESDPENHPGIWTEDIIERNYYGDVTRLRQSWSSGSGANDDLSIQNQISIVADPFANEHFATIRYVEWMNQLWKISSVEAQSPRLILTLGGLYHGDT